MPIKPELLTELFVRAESEEIGVAIETNNPEALSKQLHVHRDVAGLWSDLMIQAPSTPNTLFIMHKSVELDP